MHVADDGGFVLAGGEFATGRTSMTERLEGEFIPDGENRGRALAQLFAPMTSDYQAEFFDELAKIAKTWKWSAMQWRDMQRWLTPEAKTLIDEIKDHTDNEPDRNEIDAVAGFRS